MPGIFISYRRADSDGWAGRLRDALRARFGDLVFQDVDNIADGEIFSDVIDRALNACDVALVIIGPSWANARDEQGRRRLDVEEDWVRTETGMVLNRNIRVIPVLVGGARLPRADELPPELRSLTRRQAREIRSTSWDSDVALLASHLEQIVEPRRQRVWLYAVPAVVVAAIAGVFGGARFFGNTGPNTPLADNVPVAPAQPKSSPPEAAREPPIAEAPTKAVPEARSENADVPVRETAPRKARADDSKPLTAEHPTQRGEKKRRIAEKAEGARSEVASAERALPVRPRAAAGAPAKSAETAADVDASAGRASGTTAAVAGGATGMIARLAPLTLPNRPSSARELRIGDNWTYRLREVAYNRNLGTVTHEISGGDAGGIREIVRKSGADTERRLPLEARIFEQPLDAGATLFEFAPFMTAYSELRPGLSWNRISAPGASEEWRISGKVSGRERVSIPAGTFEAIKADLEGRRDLAFPPTRDVYNETTPSQLTYSIWYVPEIGRAVKYERRTYNRAARLLDHEQYELVSYQLK